MRYIGNKTKLIPFILDAIESIGIEPGVACDPFAGTASVARALKSAGWSVHAGDLMGASYAIQVARVEIDELPTGYSARLATLSSLTGSQGFFSDNYSAAPDAAVEAAAGRMYFSEANGRRIEAIRALISRWEAEEEIESAEARVLVATLIEAADRVANTTGVYASFVKTLQPNARRDLELRALAATPRSAGARRSSAFQGPAETLLTNAGAVDLAYFDPPYNSRQYPGYYHIPELIARGWSPEPEVRGKTGLIPDEEIRSDWCRASKAGEALRSALAAADAAHLLFSYNDEGLIPRDEIETAMRERGVSDSYRLLKRRYKRYRSDADGPSRTYARDEVSEHLHYVRCR